MFESGGGIVGTTTQVQSGPGSNGNEGVLHILPSSMIKDSPSECSMSNPENSLGMRSYPSPKMPSSNSTALANQDGISWMYQKLLYVSMS